MPLNSDFLTSDLLEVGNGCLQVEIYGKTAIVLFANSKGLVRNLTLGSDVVGRYAPVDFAAGHFTPVGSERRAQTGNG